MRILVARLYPCFQSLRSLVDYFFIHSYINRFLVEMAEQHKKAAVISAEGDTEAADLLAKAFGKAGEGLVELRRIETAEEISGKIIVRVLAYNNCAALYFVIALLKMKL